MISFVAVVARGAPRVNVTQYHNHENRDGVYIDPAFTTTAAAGLKRDLSFTGVVSGNVYAQPLYLEGGAGGQGFVGLEGSPPPAADEPPGGRDEAPVEGVVQG